MHKSPSSVRGLSLRGSSMGPKVRVRKIKPLVKHDMLAPGSAPEVPAITSIVTVDALVKELRRSLHAQFASLDPNIPTTNLYDNCSQQAFRYFTTTNTITPEAFHHKINKLGFHVPKRICLELFRLVDQEDLGELTFASFSHRIFLPSGYFNFSRPQEPDSSTSPRLSSVDATNRQPPPGLSSPLQAGSASGARQRGDSIPLIYEHLPLAEIERCISRKLEARTSRSTDRFRQAFRIFTKSEGITFADFHARLAAMQIHLSALKCRELFGRFDLDHNGTIELSEFTTALFNDEENEPALLRPTVASARSNKGSDHPHHQNLRLQDFEVEAGSALTIQEILAKLRDKLEQHTSKETDRFRQAFRIFGKSNGITPRDFNAAMTKLGLKLTGRQVGELFELFDFDKSGDLDLNEFVQGVMLDDNSTKHWYSLKDKQKVEESRRVRYSMAVQSVQDSWTISDIERMLREKIEQRTSKSSDCFRQAFRVFGKVNGIEPAHFHAALEAIGLTLDRSQADILFQRFDTNGSGDIDLDEFIHGVLPPDYTGQQWVAAADELHREAALKKKQEAMKRPDRFMTEIEMESWTLDEIEKRIRDKIQQATSKSSDTFRQAFKIFKKCNHVTIDDFRESLLALGFRLTAAQCQGLFQRYDTDNSNDIDLQEFCMRILPPDYTGDGDHWSHSEKFHKHRMQEKLEYVKRSKNGLLLLPKFDESRVRYTRGFHEVRSFADLASDDGEIRADPELIRQEILTSRPATPRRPAAQNQRPTSATSSHRPTDSGQPVEAVASPRSKLKERPPTPTSPRPDATSPSRPMSPRVSKISQSGNNSPRHNMATPPMSPRLPPPHHHVSEAVTSLATSPATSSRRPTTPRSPPSSVPRPQPSTDAYSEEDDVDDGDHATHEATGESDDEQLTLQSSSLRLLRARRAEAAHRHRRHRHADQESVSGESTASFSSTVQRAVGGAKYTPTRSNTLLMQRFLRVAAKHQATSRAAGEDARHAKSKQPHTTRV